MFNNTNKFSWAHFPVGTIVELGDIIRPYTKASPIQTVKSLVQNGPNSFLLIMEEYDEAMKMDYMFNIDHVVKIIKRGPGQPFIAEHNAGKRTTYSNNVCFNTRVNKSKGQYLFYVSVQSPIYYIALEYVPKVSCIDIEALIDYCVKYAGFKVVPDGFWGNIYIINKKKLRKFIRRNVNRFLLSPGKVQHELDMIDAEMYERDFEASYR